MIFFSRHDCSRRSGVGSEYSCLLIHPGRVISDYLSLVPPGSFDGGAKGLANTLKKSGI
jgi:hypothetical protein